MSALKSSMPVIFDGLPRLPLLTKAEEIHLATVVQAGLKPGATPRQQAAARRARHRMINANIRLVITQVKKAVRRDTPALGFDDLFQEGMLGLSRAVDLFDPSRGYKFSTYAYWWIKQSLSRAFPSYGTTIRYSTHIHDKRRAILKWVAAYQNEHRHNPTLPEIAKQFDLSLDMLAKTMACADQTKSLDASTGYEDASCLHEVIAAPPPDDDFDYDEFDIVDVMTCINLLDEKSRYVIEKRFLTKEPSSLQALAAELNVSRERVRQINCRALGQIRQRLEILRRAS